MRPRMAGAEPDAPGSNPGSFSINTKTGKWADFATGDRAAIRFSLAAYIFGCRQTEAARVLATTLGVEGAVDDGLSISIGTAPALPSAPSPASTTKTARRRFAPVPASQTLGHSTISICLTKPRRSDLGGGRRKVRRRRRSSSSRLCWW